MTARKLPRDVDARLAAVAAGCGRKPTAAHPDCTCIAQERNSGEADVRQCPVHKTQR